MAAAKFKFGSIVKAYPLDGQGEKAGIWLRESGDKDQIQVGETVWSLAYREPKDYDENGANGTYASA